MPSRPLCHWGPDGPEGRAIFFRGPHASVCCCDAHNVPGGNLPHRIIWRLPTRSIASQTKPPSPTPMCDDSQCYPGRPSPRYVATTEKELRSPRAGPSLALHFSPTATASLASRLPAARPRFVRTGAPHTPSEWPLHIILPWAPAMESTICRCAVTVDHRSIGHVSV